MVVSGLFLWFANDLLHIFPLGYGLAKVIHRFEAILAILTVAIWHMYTVSFPPGGIPMNRGLVRRPHQPPKMIHDIRSNMRRSRPARHRGWQSSQGGRPMKALTIAVLDGSRD